MKPNHYGRRYIYYYSSASPTRTRTTRRHQYERLVWTKRLVMSEDAFRIHKLSGFVYTLSSAAMMDIAAQRWLFGRQELFATIPDSVEPLLYLFCALQFDSCVWLPLDGVDSSTDQFGLSQCLCRNSWILPLFRLFLW